MPESTRDIKRRMKSVHNTKQITKAMEMVSAAKMRRSQEVALRARPYALRALELLANLEGRVDVSKCDLLETRPIKRVCLILITTDKGLCGGLNSNLLRKSLEYINKTSKEAKEVDVIVVGKKGIDSVKRLNYKIIAEFTGIGDSVDILKTTPISRLIVDEYRKKSYDQVVTAYTNFISTLKQEPIIRQVLPLTESMLKMIVGEIAPVKGRYAEAESGIQNTEYGSYEYLFEPTPEQVLQELLPKLIEIQVYQVVLEANASEHSARMVAMKNASEAAEDMIDDLNLSYNKARQAGITREIAEISAGKAALE